MKAHFVFSVLLFTFPVYLVSSSFEVVSCFCACWQPILCQQTFKKKNKIYQMNAQIHLEFAKLDTAPKSDSETCSCLLVTLLYIGINDSFVPHINLELNF